MIRAQTPNLAASASDNLPKVNATRRGISFQSPWATYAFAGLVTAATLGLRLALGAWFGDRPVLVLFFIPILLSAYFGGLGPGIFATLLAAVGTDYFLVPPVHSLTMARLSDGVQWLIFAVAGGLVGVLSEALRRARRHDAELFAQLNLAHVKLQESEVRFRAILEHSGDSISLIDANNRILYVSPSVTAVEGYLPEELIGRNGLENTHPDDLPLVDEIVRKLVEQPGQPVPVLWRRRHKLGHWLWLEGVATNLLHEPAVAAIVTNYRDVTARKQIDLALRESEALFSEAFRFSPDCVLISRVSDRTVIRANDALCRLWGKAPDDVVGKPGADFSNWVKEEERVAFVRKVTETGECLNQETTLRLQDGRLVPFSLSSRMITLKGEPCILSVMRDITERRRAEAAAITIAAIVESSDDAIVGKNLNSIVTSWNSGAEKIFGYTANEMVGESIYRIIPEERRAEEEQIVAQIVRGDQVTHFETQRRRKDGRLVEISITVSPIKDANGRVVGASKIARDISRQKQIEKALRESREKFKDLFDNAPLGYHEVDLDGRLSRVNHTELKMLGYTEEELVGQYVWKISGEEEVSRRAVLAKLGGEPPPPAFERSLRRKDGSTFPAVIEDRLVRDETGAVAGIRAVIQDITERKQAEAARRMSEARYRTLFEQAPDGILIADAASNYLDANESMCRMLGYTHDELVGLHASDIVVALELPKIEPVLREIQAGRSHHQEWQFRRKDGSVFPVEVIAAMMPDGNLLGMIRDITARKNAEQALREKERLLHATDRRLAEIMLGMTEACFALDFEWRFTFVNDRGETLLRHAREQMLGQPIWEVFHQLTGTPMEHHYRHAMAQREPAAFEAFSPIAERWLDIRLFPTGEGLAAFLLDITDRKRAEEALQRLNGELEQRVLDRTAQLEAANKELEAFSYSVSHDLRAPLRAVDGFSRIVIEDYGPQLPAEGRRYLENIGAGAQQMGVLIDDLLTFSRLSRLPLTRTAVNTGKLVDEVLDDLADLREGRRIEVQRGELPACTGDKALLKQVWLNLISNAFKYTRRREPALVEIGSEGQKGETVFFVRDNGAGFDMRYRDKLFGVFQRLHRAEEYEGTGVGLAIVQRVVHRHGGRIWAEAAVDRGATFYFTLGEAFTS